MNVRDEEFMRLALEEAKIANEIDEVPVGAVVVKDGIVIACGHNMREHTNRCNAHAEMLAILNANEVLDTWNLKGCTLYVTLEPCLMCMGAIVHARLDRIVYGASDPKAGAVESILNVNELTQLNHHPEITTGVLQEECSTILKNFFKKKREEKKRQKALEK